jgi:hypothetical protein
MGRLADKGMIRPGPENSIMSVESIGCTRINEYVHLQ